VAPRELSGAETQERYDYQVHWALCELLNRHRSGDNYCVILEYHDDVVVLDDDAQPAHAAFYQVKTKRSGHWTTTDLLKRGGQDATELSPLGKLFTHRLNFPDESISLRFVSNVPLGGKLTDGTEANERSEVRCADLPQNVRQRINAALRTELDLSPDAPLDFERITAFLWCEVNLRGSATFATGELEQFLDELFPFRKIRTTAVYQALLAELKRRSNCRERPETLAALISLHGICRRDFDGIIQRAGVHDDPAGDWQAIDAQLQNEGWPFAARLRLKSAWRRYATERTNFADLRLQYLRAHFQAWLRTCRLRDDLTLREMVDLGTAHCSNRRDLVEGYGAEYVTAMILLELMANDPGEQTDESIQLPAPGQTPARVSRGDAFARPEGSER
jgi:hypothetical protein